MIVSFGNSLAHDLYHNMKTKTVTKFPPELYHVARRKLFYLHEADNLTDLKVPPGNRLEALKGDLKGLYSIRINDQFRIIFNWQNNSAHEVRVTDYHF